MNQRYSHINLEIESAKRAIKRWEKRRQQAKLYGWNDKILDCEKAIERLYKRIDRLRDNSRIG